MLMMAGPLLLAFSLLAVVAYAEEARPGWGGNPPPYTYPGHAWNGGPWPKQGPKNSVFNYAHHGQDWDMGACSSRERQSPIDFSAYAMKQPPTSNGAVLNYNYQMITEDFDFQNNGHSLSGDFAGKGYGGITFDDGWFNLMNVNFHAKSEHTFRGVHLPMEMHLVHKRYDGPHVIIVAIMFESDNPPAYRGLNPAGVIPTELPPVVVDENTRSVIDYPNPAASSLMQKRKGKANLGRNLRAKGKANLTEAGPWFPANKKPYTPPDPLEPNSNPVLKRFLLSEPPAIGETTRLEGSELDPIDLNTLIAGGSFFEYRGSFTAPPCIERATWFVRREPIKAGDTQLKYLFDMIYRTTGDHGNYRDVMPLMGRPVLILLPKQGEPVLDVPPPLNKKQHKNTRQFKAATWAADALENARKGRDMVGELDARMRDAGQAHAQAMSPPNFTGPPFNQSQLIPTFPTPFPVEAPCVTVSCHLAKMGTEIAHNINQSAIKVVGQAGREIAKSVEQAANAAAGKVTTPRPTWAPMMMMPTTTNIPPELFGAPAAAPGAAPAAVMAAGAPAPAPVAPVAGPVTPPPAAGTTAAPNALGGATTTPAPFASTAGFAPAAAPAR